jgi:hypothetical protein
MVKAPPQKLRAPVFNSFVEKLVEKAGETRKHSGKHYRLSRLHYDEAILSNLLLTKVFGSFRTEEFWRPGSGFD